MSNIPIINGSALPAERLLLHRTTAQQTVRRWIEYMRTNRLAYCSFHTKGVPANDEGGLSVGMRVEELALEGYAVICQSSSIVQQDAEGTLITLVTTLVKAPEKKLFG